jgi:hypothetical protein
VNYLVTHILSKLEQIRGVKLEDVWLTIQEVVVLQASHIPIEQLTSILKTFERVGYNSDVIKQLIELKKIVNT